MFVSVVVRSYQRPEALEQLVAALREQDHPAFEIVILEQSNDPALVARIEALGDPRVRIFAEPVRDPPAARNAAIRHAKGEILLFVDDDDLPVGQGFVAAHAKNYEDDPSVMGVVGRLVSKPEGEDGPRFPKLVRLFAMKRSFFWDTRALTHNTLRKEHSDFLIGSNASVRRALVERIGGWDEGIPMYEELSFSIRFHKGARPGEHFVFDPEPVLWRRTDIAGGLDRRGREDWWAWELDARLFYYRNVVGHYFPTRYRVFAPLFSLRAVSNVIAWVWDPDNGNRSVGERIAASFGAIARLPSALRASRFRKESIKRMETWR